jgi:hypothetical protein
VKNTFFFMVAKRHRTSKVVDNNFKSSNLKNALVSLKIRIPLQYE